MRRARLSVRPNIGAPKTRGSTAAATPGTTTENETQKPVGTSTTNQGTEEEKVENTTSKNTEEESVSQAKKSEETVVGKSKSKATRRSVAKPKPNIPGRGATRSKATDAEPDECQVSVDEFTNIKPIAVEDSVKKSTDQVDKPAAVTPEKPTVQLCETPGSSDNVAPTDKTVSTDDAKKENKIRFRSRFTKARPNVEATARPRIRHPSFSHDAENSMVREPPSVNRVTTLSNSESTPSTPVFRKPADFTPGKEGIDIRRMPLKIPTRDEHRLLQQDDQSKKRKKVLVLEEPVDRGKLKMRDLIHMNPKSNPMKVPTEEEERRESIIELSPPAKPRTRRDSTASSTSSNKVKIGEDGQIVLDDDGDDETDSKKEGENETEEKVEDEDNAVPAPQVTIGADGEIILNESSLVLHNPIHDTTQEEMEVVHETNSWTKGGSKYGYRKKRFKQWTENETKKFYLALNAVGTDFSVMVKLFPGRTRAELKRKWQREEKTSRHLLDKAITDRYQFEKDFFEELYELDKLDEQLKESKQLKAAEKKAADKTARKKKLNETDSKTTQESQPKRKKRRKGKRKAYMDSESEEEEVADIEKDTNNEDGDDNVDEAEVIANMQNKPSRSGRTIKTFVLGQTGATSTASISDEASMSSPVGSPKPSTEIRIRRISGTPSSPGPPRARARTLSNSSEPRIRTLSGSSTASVGKTPGQFLALSNIQKSNSDSQGSASDMQPGSLVFVQSNPTVNEKGEVTPGLVHIYMVSSPSAPNSSSSPKAGPSVGSEPSTPGGFKSNQFSLMKSPVSDGVRADSKIHHSPTILRKSSKSAAPMSPGTPTTIAMPTINAQNLSTTLSEIRTVLADTEPTHVEENCNNSGLKTVEVVTVEQPSSVQCVEPSTVLVEQEQANTETVFSNDTPEVTNNG